MRGSFLHNFINVLLGFVLVTSLPTRLFNPPSSRFTSRICQDVVHKQLGQGADATLDDLVDEIVTKWAASAELQCKDLDLFPREIDRRYIREFCKQISQTQSNPPASTVQGKSKVIIDILQAGLKDRLGLACDLRLVLFILIILFMVKYLHELSKIEEHLHTKDVHLPCWMNAFHFTFSLLLAAAFVFLIRFSNSLVPWGVFAAIFVGFLVNDGILFLAHRRKLLETSPVPEDERKKLILLWLALDGLILIAMLTLLGLRWTRGPEDVTGITFWSGAMVLGIFGQILAPYIVCRRFYFGNY
jgi:hypothetical protein